MRKHSRLPHMHSVTHSVTFHTTARPSASVFSPSALALALLMGLAIATLSQAQTAAPAASSVGSAGEVEFVRGVGFAQTPGQQPRTLGKGLALKEGDRVTTADGASAIVKLEDGTRMTVRPNTEMVLSQFKFKQDAPDNSLVLNLLRGGLRSITGLIAKGSPNAARIQTSTATIGIRGTDFDARICRQDCGQEASRVADRAKPNVGQASARVISARGAELVALDSKGERRRLVDGGAVYPGDVVETGQATQAVLSFRDESRVSIGVQTRFRVDNYVFDAANPADGSMLTSILKGSVRALSGLIARSNNRNVRYSTSTATIGIRGTEVLISCQGTCANEAPLPLGDGLQVFTFSGLVVVQPNGLPNQPPPAPINLNPQQGTQIGGQGTSPLTTEPSNNLTPPGSLQQPPGLFGGTAQSESQEGLYVFVRDGHIQIDNGANVLHLGRNEAGFAGEGGSVTRPTELPRFIEFDNTPLPNARNLTVAQLLGTGNTPTRVCK
jgi:hypothetical protein